MNKKIRIKNSEKDYFIEIEYNSFKKKLINLIHNHNKTFIIIDRNVEYLLKNINFSSNVFIFKNYEILTKKILLAGVDRKSLMVAIGGGTIGDLTGFVASTILRGVKLILIPTTLLSQVDSSIGGKNGINTTSGKNLIGTFYQPHKVFIDPKILKSLSKRELKSGYAEIVKHALINDNTFFYWLEKNYKRIFKLEKNALIYSIYKSIKIKAKFVTLDSKEILANDNSRAILNFGHTFGHALETLYQYRNKITHGEAISIGMIIVSNLSNKLCNLNTLDLERIINHFLKVDLPIKYNKINNKKILKLIQIDKKNNEGKINLILLKKIGKAYYSKNLNPKLISEILN